LSPGSMRVPKSKYQCSSLSAAAEREESLRRLKCELPV